MAMSQLKEIVKTDKAPVPIAAYNQAIKSNGMLYVAGQVGANPADRKLVEGGIEPETVRALENVKAIVEAAGSSLDLVVNVTLYLKDIAHFAKVNEIYSLYFTQNFPARTTIAVANLPSEASIEITVIAALPKRQPK